MIVCPDRFALPRFATPPQTGRRVCLPRLGPLTPRLRVRPGCRPASVHNLWSRHRPRGASPAAPLGNGRRLAKIRAQREIRGLGRLGTPARKMAQKLDLKPILYACILYA